MVTIRSIYQSGAFAACWSSQRYGVAAPAIAGMAIRNQILAACLRGWLVNNANCNSDSSGCGARNEEACTGSNMKAVRLFENK